VLLLLLHRLLRPLTCLFYSCLISCSCWSRLSLLLFLYFELLLHGLLLLLLLLRLLPGLLQLL
jgi:hypothetical protein